MELPRFAAATRAFWTVASSSWTVMFRFMRPPCHVFDVYHVFYVGESQTVNRRTRRVGRRGPAGRRVPARRRRGARLPVAPSCDGEGEEVGVEQLGGGSVLVVPDEEVAYDLARPRDLTQARPPPPRVRKGQVEQLQRAIECRIEATLVAFLSGPDRAADVRSCVAELLRKGERPPATARQACVHRHRATNRSTIDVTVARTAASSTERVRFPCLGRMLMTESNSMNLGVPNCAG